MSEETGAGQGSSGAAAETPVAERSLLGVLASDANTVAVTTVATALSTAAGYTVKNMMNKHGQGGDGPSKGDGGEPGAPA
jgi:hypothetical protein